MLQVDCDFPGGNIIVDSIEGDTLNVHQDVRDTTTDWFYWYFRVRGAAQRHITVNFTKSNVLGVRGPGVSTDGGQSWAWLGAEPVQGQSFEYSVPAGVDDLRFSFGMPYLQANLGAFLARHTGSPHLQSEVLCTTRKGRPVELLHLGRLDGQAPHKVLLTCRHHCCEMMASYELEGIMEHVLAGGDSGAWLRQNVEFMVLPFADKDGVEDGDQGKNRAPRDHNRDYDGVSVHVETAAMREQMPAWAGERLRIGLDLHCPHIRGEHNEDIYFVGGPDAEIWQRVNEFGQAIERVQTGPLVFSTQHNLPFGMGWNKPVNLSQGMSAGRAAAELLGAPLAASLELPYANASGREVNTQTARAFGHDLARAIRCYLE